MFKGYPTPKKDHFVQGQTQGKSAEPLARGLSKRRWPATETHAMPLPKIDRAAVICAPGRWPSGYGMVARQLSAMGVEAEAVMGDSPELNPGPTDCVVRMRCNGICG